MDAVRAAEPQGQRKRPVMRVAATVAAAVGLVALSARAYGAGGRTELSFDPVAAAIASHDSGGAARPAPAAQQVLASRASQGPSLSNMKSWSVSEHPWDVSPEGMPTANGQLISAAQMFADAGEPAPQPARGGNTLGLRTVAQAKAEANRRMAGGGSGDPDVSLDLEEVFAQHDAGDQTAAVQQTVGSASLPALLPALMCAAMQSPLPRLRALTGAARGRRQELRRRRGHRNGRWIRDSRPSARRGRWRPRSRSKRVNGRQHSSPCSASAMQCPRRGPRVCRQEARRRPLARLWAVGIARRRFAPSSQQRARTRGSRAICTCACRRRSSSARWRGTHFTHVTHVEGPVHVQTHMHGHMYAWIETHSMCQVHARRQRTPGIAL